MDQRLKEYIEYYEARFKKYKGNPLYKNSEESEKNLYDAIKSCNTLEEFKTKLEEGNLSNKNAAALVRDQETAGLKAFNEMEETIRAKAPQEILNKLDDIKDVTELTNLVNGVLQKVNNEVTIDELVRIFYADFVFLENIEVWTNAEIDDEFKDEVKNKWVNDASAEGKKVWKENFLPQYRQIKEDWNLDYNLVLETRHRRLIPAPDEIVRKRIEQHKKFRGVSSID